MAHGLVIYTNAGSVAVLLSCAPALGVLVACHPASQAPRSSDAPSHVVASSPAASAASRDAGRAVPSHAPAASDQSPPATPEPSPGPAAWRVANEQYLFSPEIEEPPPLEKCGVFADAKQLQRHRPAGAPTIATAQCLPLGEGRAWGIVRAHERWAAAYAAGPGHLAVGPWKPEYPTRNDREETMFTSPTGELPEALFDWDGDGVPEYLHPVILTDPGSGGNAVVYAELWSYRAGKVVRVPQVPSGIRLVRDVDDDGRPDLLLSPFQGKLSFGICFDVFDANHAESTEGLFAAHSLSDGSFTLTDQVAIDVAKNWCKAPPSSDASADAYRAIPCGRAWGMDAASLQPFIDAHCQEQIASCPSAKCIDRSQLGRWTKIDAPLRLVR